MKIKVKCGNCTAGQKSNWGPKDEWIIEDCPNCNGSGIVEIELIDKRQKTKKQKMIVPDKY